MFSFPNISKKLRKHPFDETSTTNSSQTTITTNSSSDFCLTPIDDNSMPSIHSKQKLINILIVGQIYEETILTVDDFPNEDTTTKTPHKHQQACGGRGVQTASILAQFPKITPFIMSSVGTGNSSKLFTELESKGVRTSTCFQRKSPTPSAFIIQSTRSNSRTVICHNT